MSTSPLPTPTALLTSLFAALPPLPPTAPLPSNPLLSAPPSTKSLFLTLHALFPNEFLPALDLLDRGLVTRVVIGQESEQEREREQAPFLMDRDAEAECRLIGEGEGEGDAAAAAHDAGFREEEQEEEEEEDGHGDRVEDGDRARARPRPKEKGKGKENSTTKPKGTTAQGPWARNAVYYVHSAASTAQRPGRHPSARLEKKSYEVRLRAWNCSCPAFTFSAFSSTQAPSVASARRASVDGVVDVDEGMEIADGGNAEDGGGGEGGMEKTEESEEWVFGGLSSLWGAGEKSVPVCKHLLACAVGERCGLLGGFVVERVVGKGEAAGLGAGWSG